MQRPQQSQRSPSICGERSLHVMQLLERSTSERQQRVRRRSMARGTNARRVVAWRPTQATDDDFTWSV